MARTRVKICGITRPSDAETAAGCGADAIGLVFYARSPRHVEIAQAQEIIAALPAFVATVGLFLDPDRALVESVLTQLPLDLLQFHGQETVEFCESFTRPYIKALGNDRLTQLDAMHQYYSGCKGFLLDSHASGEAGGTGETFDWSAIPDSYRSRIILAGGLKPENVAEAIRRVRPYAIDLSSGVESAPGIKDATRIEQLMNEVQGVDSEHS